MNLAINGRFLAAEPVTGVQRVARQIVAGLGQTADITLYLPRGAEAPGELDACRVVRGTLSGVPWEQLELPARALGNGTGLSLDPANAGPVLGGRRVMVLHDVFPVTHPEWYTARFRQWFRLVVARAARRAVGVVMFSEWARQEAIRAIGLEPGRIVVARQGTAPFDGPPPRDEVRSTLSRLGLRPGYVLATGEGDPRKNTGFLGQVLGAMDEAERPTLVLTGAPFRHVRPPTGPAQAFPARRLGFVSDRELRALYAGAGVFCFPSLAEGFGRPPLEAMACGTPVIAGSYGSAREVLGDAARILPLEPRTWADAIRRMLADSAERQRWASRGRRHADGWHWDRTARMVLDLCRSAAPGGRADVPPAGPGGR